MYGNEQSGELSVDIEISDCGIWEKPKMKDSNQAMVDIKLDEKSLTEVLAKSKDQKEDEETMDFSFGATLE